MPPVLSDHSGEKMKIVGIYNAKGTIGGEIAYVLKKLMGQGSCALCDISHGWNPFGKASWKSACEASPLELKMLHLEEASETQLQAAGQLPAFIVEHEGRWGILMTAEEIQNWTGNPKGLLLALEDKKSPLQDN